MTGKTTDTTPRPDLPMKISKWEVVLTMIERNFDKFVFICLFFLQISFQSWLCSFWVETPLYILAGTFSTIAVDALIAFAFWLFSEWEQAYEEVKAKPSNLRR